MTVVSFIWKFFFFEQGKEVVLESEVQVLSRLRHPNIVKLYDVIDSESTLCLVLELVEVSACARCVNLARPCMNNSLTISRIFFLFFDLSLSLSLLFYHVLFCSILFYSVLFFVSAIYLFVFGFFFFFGLFWFLARIDWRAATCLMPSPPPANSANRKPSGWRKIWRRPWRTFTRSASFIVTSSPRTFS